MNPVISKYVIPAAAAFVALTFLWSLFQMLAGQPVEFGWKSLVVAALGWIAVAIKDWKDARNDQPATE